MRCHDLPKHSKITSSRFDALLSDWLWMHAAPVGHSLLVCTFFVVLFTVLINGGASTWMMTKLKLRAEDEEPKQVALPSIL